MLDWIEHVARFYEVVQDFTRTTLASTQSPQLRASLPDFKQKASKIELAIVEQTQTRLATGLRNSVLDVIVTGSTLLWAATRSR